MISARAENTVPGSAVTPPGGVASKSAFGSSAKSFPRFSFSLLATAYSVRLHPPSSSDRAPRIWVIMRGGFAHFGPESRRCLAAGAGGKVNPGGNHCRRHRADRRDRGLGGHGPRARTRGGEDRRDGAPAFEP